MTNVRVPGFVWVILLIVIGALIQAHALQIESQTGLSAVEVDLIVSALFGAYKYFNLGTDQLNAALDVIAYLKERLKGTQEGQTRGIVQAPLSQPALREDDIPKRPNKVARWLVG